MPSLIKKLKNKVQDTAPEKMSLEKYLELAAKDKSLYASPAERMVEAIGKPVFVDTSKDLRLSKIHNNRVIKIYEPFNDFYGMEEVIEGIVSFYTHASQGLEEEKQILYLLGPVGSAKSSLAERLKELICKVPFYAIEGSPIQESPLGLLSPSDSKLLGIPERYLKVRPSPWALKRLKEHKGDISKFNVVKLYPNQAYQIAVTKTEPGDENNQDISTLVGKTNYRKMEFFDQSDPDCYSFSGGLCKANRGVLDFVEMFKAPIKMLHPLLTATQEGNYNGTEALPSIPFDGLIVAHSNESEWEKFRSNKNNEAFLDRVCIRKVPYCLRTNEEIDIYQKLINNSSLLKVPCAPGTLETLSSFSVLTRLEEHENSSAEIKMMVYNGENVKDRYPNAKSLQEYRDKASNKEGFSGFSTRQAFKVLSQVFNYDPHEVAADPVHMLVVLNKTVDDLDLSGDKRDKWFEYINGYLGKELLEKVGKDIQTAYLDSYSEFGQSLFDRYILFADHWVEDRDYRDPDTGQLFDRESLNKELEKVEKPAGIANPKDFRTEVVNFAIRYRAKHNNKNPSWNSYEKMREVIEKTMFSKTEDLLPVISFSSHGSQEDKKKHKEFVDRMVDQGYTPRQVRRVVEWHMRYSKSD